MTLRRSILLFAAMWAAACTGSAAAPPADGGVFPEEDGGAVAEDGGPAPDGGAPARDGGTPARDGGAADGGPASDGGPDTACDPYLPRAPAPGLLIGPTGLQTALLSRVNAAQSELLVMMYQLTVRSFVDAFIAAKNRGVDVRVLLDGAQTVNNDARQRLTTAGVPVKTAPARYTNNHAKVIVVDRTEAVVMSANLNGYSMSSERNYGAALQDGQDIADLVTIFEVDWADSAILDLSCTRLLVSPVNSRTRLDGLIRGARQRLDLAVMYISDSSLRDAVKARAAAGVPVRVLLADPAWIDGNQATATELAAAGIAVRFLRSWELHAKLVLSDDTAFVGSQNLSWTSLERNREVGLFVTEPAPESAAARQFEIDWSQGDPP